MNAAYGLWLVAWGLCLSCAQGDEALGFVRMLHAVGAGTGKLEFSIDGKPVRPDGYQLGNVTGGIALKVGTHRVLFRRDGVKEGETSVTVAANDTTILIAYAEQTPATENPTPAWRMRILRLKQHESDDQRTASFVSVSKEPELKVEMRQLDGKWQAVPVKRLNVARAEIQQSRGYMPVRCNGRDLTTLSIASSGNFVVVLYEDESGALRSKNFQDYKYLSPD